MLIIAIALLASPTIECGDWAAGDRSPQSVRDETRARIGRTCQSLGASHEACTVLDEITIRESSGDPCAVHTLGPGEWGLGPLGLSWRWHRGKWDREADPSIFHVPEVAAIVTIRIWRRAVARYGATTWTRVNSVFAGRLRWWDLDLSLDSRFCARLASRGVDCNDDPREQLGTAMGSGPDPDQDQFVRRLIDGQRQRNRMD